MFDFAQRGTVETHRYRGYYDAGEGSTIRCAVSNHVIRYCYSLHDQNEKSFVIGSCCFALYEGTKTFIQLEAAKVLQASLKAAIAHDTRLHGSLESVREQRKQWQNARREGLRLLRAYRKSQGDWLPKPLYDLNETVQRRPRSYKMQSAALRWYEKQISKLSTQTKEARLVLSI